MKALNLKSKALNFKSLVMLLLMSVFVTTAATAQTMNKKDNSITAIALYQAFRTNKAKPYQNKVMQISGIATSVGPDPYALPSVEIAEAKDKSSRVLCVLPFSDYLKLRHVSKGDQVVIQGEARGFSAEHNYVVVKECKILTVNGKKQ